ncbi:MAG TPA: mercury methylation corrinoid protein HgcA, partial [Spirochaetota bacterium]
MSECGCGKQPVIKMPAIDLKKVSITGFQADRNSHIFKEKYVSGRLTTPVGDVPIIHTKLTMKDYLGGVGVRWGRGRMDYQVAPGLYAVGSPNEDSPVLVSANYKLTFDSLRKELGSQNVWILILDTKGVNVWCAAGKGTFGTKELIGRIESSKVAQVVRHRTLVLPQLGAPGIESHIVSKHTSFRIVYGPVLARDLPQFIENGMKKDERMSTVTFTLRERLAVVPMEIVGVAKFLPLFFLLGAVPALIETSAVRPSIYEGLLFIGAVITGTVFVPAALPLFAPVRAFSGKGYVAGALVAIIAAFCLGAGIPKGISWALIAAPISGYLALQFTGASTYTSESGVRREIRLAMP